MSPLPPSRFSAIRPRSCSASTLPFRPPRRPGAHRGSLCRLHPARRANHLPLSAGPHGRTLDSGQIHLGDPTGGRSRRGRRGDRGGARHLRAGCRGGADRLSRPPRPADRLANRALLQERTEQALAVTARGGLVAMLCLDLDLFKTVNTRSATPRATRCSARSPTGSPPGSARPTRSRGSAGTSSRCCRRASNGRRTPDGSPRAAEGARHAVRARRADDPDLREPRDRGGPARRHRLSGAAAQGGRRALSRQGRRPRPVAFLRTGDGSEPGGAGADGARPSPGLGAGRIRRALHAAGRAGQRTDRRIRGAAALAASRTWPAAARGLPPARRGDRADRPDRRLDAGAGLRRGHRLAGADRGHGDPVGGATARRHPGARGQRDARRRRVAGGAARAQHHGIGAVRHTRRSWPNCTRCADRGAGHAGRFRHRLCLLALAAAVPVRQDQLGRSFVRDIPNDADALAIVRAVAGTRPQPARSRPWPKRWNPDPAQRAAGRGLYRSPGTPTTGAPATATRSRRCSPAPGRRLDPEAMADEVR